MAQPDDITNGDVADAVQVQAWFDYLLGQTVASSITFQPEGGNITSDAALFMTVAGEAAAAGKLLIVPRVDFCVDEPIHFTPDHAGLGILWLDPVVRAMTTGFPTALCQADSMAMTGRARFRRTGTLGSGGSSFWGAGAGGPSNAAWFHAASFMKAEQFMMRGSNNGAGLYTRGPILGRLVDPEDDPETGARVVVTASSPQTDFDWTTYSDRNRFMLDFSDTDFGWLGSNQRDGEFHIWFEGNQVSFDKEPHAVYSRARKSPGSVGNKSTIIHLHNCTDADSSVAMKIFEQIGCSVVIHNTRGAAGAVGANSCDGLLVQLGAGYDLATQGGYEVDDRFYSASRVFNIADCINSTFRMGQQTAGVGEEVRAFKIQGGDVTIGHGSFTSNFTEPPDVEVDIDVEHGVILGNAVVRLQSFTSIQAGTDYRNHIKLKAYPPNVKFSLLAPIPPDDGRWLEMGPDEDNLTRIDFVSVVVDPVTQVITDPVDRIVTMTNIIDYITANTVALNINMEFLGNGGAPGVRAIVRYNTNENTGNGYIFRFDDQTNLQVDNDVITGVLANGGSPTLILYEDDEFVGSDLFMDIGENCVVKGRFDSAKTPWGLAWRDHCDIDPSADLSELIDVAALSTDGGTLTGPLRTIAGVTAAPGLQIGSATTGFIEDSSDIVVVRAGVNKLRLGAAVQEFLNSAGNAQFRTIADGAYSSGFDATRYSNNNGAPQNFLRKARGSKTTPLTPSSGDQLGEIIFQFVTTLNPTTWLDTARIVGKVIAATPSDTDSQGQLVFYTTPAAAVTVSEIVRLDHAGGFQMFGSNTVVDINRLVVMRTYTVATLPAAPANGARAMATNALTPTFGAAVVGGGSVKIPVYYDGAWKVG